MSVSKVKPGPVISFLRKNKPRLNKMIDLTEFHGTERAVAICLLGTKISFGKEYSGTDLWVEDPECGRGFHVGDFHTHPSASVRTQEIWDEDIVDEEFKQDRSRGQYNPYSWSLDPSDVDYENREEAIKWFCIGGKPEKGRRQKKVFCYDRDWDYVEL